MRRISVMFVGSGFEPELGVSKCAFSVWNNITSPGGGRERGASPATRGVVKLRREIVS
jgi:hypothetical protein